jgi:hypothetical protein
MAARMPLLVQAPASTPAADAGVVYIACMLALTLGLPGLVALARALWFLAASAPALATVAAPEPGPEGAPATEGAAAARPAAAYCLGFDLPDGRRQQATLRHAPSALDVLLPRQLGPRPVPIRYSRRDPADIRLAAQLAQSVLYSLVLVAAAGGIAWALLAQR